MVRSTRVALVLVLAGLPVCGQPGSDDEQALQELTARVFSAFGNREAGADLYPSFSVRVREKVSRELLAATFEQILRQRLVGTKIEVIGTDRATATCERLWEENGQRGDPLVLYFVKEDAEWRVTTHSRGAPSWWPEALSKQEQEALNAAETWLGLVERKDWDGLYELAPYPVRARYSQDRFTNLMSQYRALPATVITLKVPEFRTDLGGGPLPEGLMARVYFVAHLRRQGKLLPCLATPCLHVAREGDRWAVSYSDPGAIAQRALRTVDLYNIAWQAGDLNGLRGFLTPEAQEAISDEDLEAAIASIAPPGEQYTCRFGEARLAAFGEDGVTYVATYTIHGEDEETSREYAYQVVFRGSGLDIQGRLAALATEVAGAEGQQQHRG